MESIARYIAVEGPIGVGKSTLATLLSRELNGGTLLEEVEENPFMHKFYSDIKNYAFQTQLFFLLSRYKQQQQLSQCDLFSMTVISDYLFAKDRIFAFLNLSENEVVLYEQIYKLLNARIAKPNLVIYLQASSDTLIERIDKRNLTFEKDIEPDYLEKVVDAYNKYFFYYNETPLLVVNTEEVDFENNPRDLNNLVREILSVRGGTQHYIPLGS